MASLLETRQNNSRNGSLGLTSQPSSTSASYSDLCNNPSSFTTSAVSAMVASCYGILIPLTVLGNGSVIAAFAYNTGLRTATNIFIIGLAASDLLVGTFAIPFWTFVVSHENIMVGYCFSVYNVYIIFDVFAGCASILQLTAIAMERFLSTQWPLFHRKMSHWVYCIMLLVAWLCAAVMAAVHPLQAQTGIWKKTYTLVLFTFCFVFPLIIIVTCYCYIFKISRFQTRRRLSTGSHSKHCGRTPGRAIKELNIAITVAVITGLFIAAWLPFFVVSVIATFCLSCLPPGPNLLYLVKFLKFFQYSSSCVNPYIYAYRNKEMRRTLVKIARKMFPCNPLGLGTNLNIAKRDSKNRGQSSGELQARGSENCPAIDPKSYTSSEKEVFKEEIKIKQQRKLQKKDKKKMVVIFL